MVNPNYPPYGAQTPYAPYGPYAPAKGRRARQPMSAAAKALVAALLTLTVFVTGSAAVLIADGIRNYYSEEDPYSESTGGIPLTPEDEGWQAPAPNMNAPKIELHMPGTAENAMTDRDAAAKVSPSVVGIVSYGYSWGGEKEAYSEGSGVVITSDGYILTNAHVVDGGEAFLIIDYKGNSYDAVVIGADTRTDLAVLRVTADVEMVPAEFGDSEQTAVGDAVMAIGNPGGQSYAGSVTYGHVSAVDRVITTNVNVFGLFQVDAAINPGNSGGALVNQWGQVIGINCAKVVAEDYEGIGFAIPISKAKLVADTLMKYGYMKDRIWLGISVIAVDTITAAFEGTRTGIQIVELLENNVFSATKVRANDIIIAMNNVRITDSAVFFEMLYTCKPRDKADFTLYRPSTGETFTVTVALLGEYY